MPSLKLRYFFQLVRGFLLFASFLSSLICGLKEYEILETDQNSDRERNLQYMHIVLILSSLQQ